MKTYIKPIMNVVDILSKDNILLNVSSGGGGNDNPIQGIGEGNTTISGGGTRVPLRTLWI